jgi:hypothetical protein
VIKIAVTSMSIPASRLKFPGLGFAAMCAAGMVAPLVLTVAATSLFGTVRPEFAAYETIVLLALATVLIGTGLWLARRSRAAAGDEDEVIDEFRDDVDRLQKRVDPHF